MEDPPGGSSRYYYWQLLPYIDYDFLDKVDGFQRVEASYVGYLSTNCQAHRRAQCPLVHSKRFASTADSPIKVLIRRFAFWPWRSCSGRRKADNFPLEYIRSTTSISDDPSSLSIWNPSDNIIRVRNQRASAPNLRSPCTSVGSSQNPTFEIFVFQVQKNGVLALMSGDLGPRAAPDLI